MNKYTRIAFTSYLLIVITGALIGFRYLLAAEIMPHHYQIIGIESWSFVVESYKVMLLSLMKSAGLGYLTTAIAIAVLLFGPFRNNERWSIWGLAIISVTQLSGRLVSILNTDTQYHTSATVTLLAIAWALFLIGFLCSLKTQAEPEIDILKSPGEMYPISSVICYSLVGLMGLITAWIFMTSDQVMPYHLDAMGVSSWSALEKGYQMLLLLYLRAIGLGFLVVSVAIAVILVALIRKPSKWLRRGMLLMVMTQTLVMIFIVITVRFNTPGSPPILPLSIATVLIIMGFSIPLKKNKNI